MSHRESPGVEGVSAGIFMLAAVQAVGAIVASFAGHSWTAGALVATAIVLVFDFVGSTAH